jgi:hypothetical protein
MPRLFHPSSLDLRRNNFCGEEYKFLKKAILNIIKKDMAITGVLISP